ncbi:DUF4982 domain-containing protein [Tamlana fucoidanivorans]|uniref:Glycoside hydrolase family 2 protein n=1 Tax=Allotamlana fucoidanivorans TaxID=2583814 RepID=A0A5C4SQQ4_9FLAO|nr:glycoside hydrolase family 2 TIM barrel-domain containing protein [Tamlana fucoidanivorans]TNJ46595.1 glycoside hydrolase family 2 protein [Tamlana fucoidanivorans]
MKIKLKLILSVLCFSTFVLAQNSNESVRQKTNINQGWRFHLGDPNAQFYNTDYDDSKWEVVHVPHSLELTSMDLNGYTDDKYQKTFMRNVGWYRRDIEVTKDKTKKVFLEFEGVHQVTDVWVNGKHVGQHAVGGYTPFHFDISSFVSYGEKNLVTVLADNRRREDVPPDPGPMDYIKFGGLYRDVYLVETNATYISFNWESETSGQYITTPTVDPVNMNGTVNIKTEVKNETDEAKTVTVINRLVDDKNIVVLKLSQTKSIDANSKQVFNQIGSIEDNLKLWSIDTPNLYRVNTTVYELQEKVDEIECKMGFRKIEITHSEGLLLNGKPVKLIGTNRHQHYGFIGDAMPNTLHYKDVLQIKKLGMNVLRTAHYPHDNAVIEACDELGILVYEEAPTWMSIGNEAWFENYEKAARTMVRNHRNHPSVIIWGAGINHRGYVPRAHNVIKQEDPVRFTASQSSRWTGWQTSGLTDIYGQMVYGPYYWSQDEPMLAMEGGRGPAAVNHYLDDPMKLGLISWTAHAYYTFHPSDNPKDRSRSGLMTVFRYPRPGLMWYKAELTQVPYTHIETEWKADVEDVVVYSNASKVELFLNGSSLGVQHPSKQDDYKYLKHAPFIFKIQNYNEGELVAHGLVEGKVVSKDVVKTPEDAYKIVLELDTEGRSFVADGSDIVVAYAKVVDKNGTIIQDDRAITFSVSGDAHIVGEDKAIGANPFGTTYGVAPALIQSGTRPSKITVTAKAKGLKSGSAIINSEAAHFDCSQIEPIHDFESVKVDLGETEQLVQFDWIPWSSEDMKNAEKSFTQLGGFTSRIESVDSPENTRWLGEINVIGKYGFAHGEGILGTSKNGLNLEFKGLKKGRYKLTTFHHAPRTNTDSMDPNQEKMATYKIYQIPAAKHISAEIHDAKGAEVISKIVVTDGKDMQTKPFGNTDIYIESDGVNPIQIVFKSEDGKAVWLNSFILSEWF